MVTARHVVDGTNGLVALMRRRTDDAVDRWDVPAEGWIFPEDDVTDIAVHPFNPPAQGHVLLPVDLDAANDAQPLELGQPVFYVGLLGWDTPMRDEARPVVMSGTTAALNQTGIWWGPCDKPENRTADVVHLIDGRPREGFSGSPCFVQWLLPSTEIPERNEWSEEWSKSAEFSGNDPDTFGWNHTMTHWLGMIAGFGDRFGVGIVIPASEIVKFINGPEMAEERSKQEIAVVKHRRAKGPVSSKRPPEISEFDAFEDLARRIVQVPKSEIDEMRDNDAEQR